MKGPEPAAPQLAHVKISVPCCVAPAESARWLPTALADALGLSRDAVWAEMERLGRGVDEAGWARVAGKRSAPKIAISKSPSRSVCFSA